MAFDSLAFYADCLLFVGPCYLCLFVIVLPQLLCALLENLSFEEDEVTMKRRLISVGHLLLRHRSMVELMSELAFIEQVRIAASRADELHCREVASEVLLIFESR